MLASLLIDDLGLKPRATAKKVILDGDDNARLRDWQFAHLRVSWCAPGLPGEVEQDVPDEERRAVVVDGCVRSLCKQGLT